MRLTPGQRVHFVGIGGAGLSAIARVMLQQGYTVSGSDRGSNAQTEALTRDGVTIYKGHDPAYVLDAEMVIVSSAVTSNHIEVLAAQSQGIPVYKRSDMMAALMSGHINIAVAGTHGKSTTTALVTHILIEAGQNPSYIVGSAMGNTGTNAAVGSGRIFVIEADEYDNMFHGLQPNIEIITSIEYDHPDFFPTPNAYIDSFSRFIGLLPKDGLLIACADDVTTNIFAENRFIVNLPITTYGISNPRAAWRAVRLRSSEGGTAFEVVRRGAVLGTVNLPLSGRHNVLNALAALIAADSQGVTFTDAAAALKKFKGLARRFEVRGESDGVIVIDDYAHNPTKIKATLQAARFRYPDAQIWAVWQPHTYTRTQTLLDLYAAAFDNANHVLVTEIYAAREQPIEGINGAEVVKAIQHKDVCFIASLSDATDYLLKAVKAPAVIIVMSAGDATQISADYLRHKSEAKSEV
ncbi:MAG: UDP-N-acetylmuramate--L-alanine ligase [Chitinophagaceae bacterium]|nr:UDP-N-acetylmuramate--L-alanine ligase [Anaerolineae bacterium]